MRGFSSVAVVLLIASLARSAGAQSAGVTSAAISPADLRLRLFAIADDSMGGRQSGSLGNLKTTEYVAAEFRRLGLQPAGDGGSWFQTVPFYFAEPGSRTLAVGGAALTFGTDYVLIGRAVAAPPLDGVPAIYGGAANDPSTWISADQSAGKVVVLDVRPGADGRRTLVQRLRGVVTDSRFARAAALAVAELDLFRPEIVAQFASQRLTADTSRASGQPALLLISPRAAEVLLGAATDRLAAGASGRAVRGEVAPRFTPVPFAARNVVAVLPGRDPALRGQYVALTAHNDHVGFTNNPVDHDSIRAHNQVVRPMGADSPDRPATADEQTRIRQLLDSLRRLRPARLDSIRNGADDDGTGTVAILEIAEALAAGPTRPRRSILFVSHTGEEEGLVGSEWFTDHPTVPIDSIVAAIDEDMVGRGGRADLPAGGPTYLEVIGARRLSNDFGDLLEAANAAQSHPFTFDYSYDAPGHPLQYYCRADHYSYARYGIPSVALSRGEHLDYHQVTDEAQYIDYPGLARVARLVHDAALRIANRDQRPKLDRPKGDPHAPCVQ